MGEIIKEDIEREHLEKTKIKKIFINGERIYLKRNFLGWSVIHPIRPDGKLNGILVNINNISIISEHIETKERGNYLEDLSKICMIGRDYYIIACSFSDLEEKLLNS